VTSGIERIPRSLTLFFDLGKNIVASKRKTSNKDWFRLLVAIRNSIARLKAAESISRPVRSILGPDIEAAARISCQGDQFLMSPNLGKS
jgi:hypothetical protein